MVGFSSRLNSLGKIVSSRFDISGDVSTSSNASSYRLAVNPIPVRAIAERVSLHRTRSRDQEPMTSFIDNLAVTARRVEPPLNFGPVELVCQRGSRRVRT